MPTRFRTTVRQRGERQGPWMKQRFPTAPLIAYAAAKHQAEPLSAPHIEDSGRAAAMLDVYPKTIHRWISNGETLSVTQADRYAILLGAHPCEVWPNWFDEPTGLMTASR